MSRKYFFEHGGEMTAIGDGELKIGSGADADLIVPGDKVEPLTAVARVEDDGVVLESRANENEAKVNGQMLSLADLAPGTAVKVGDLELTVGGEVGQLVLEGDAGSFSLKVGANLVGRAPEAGVLLDHPSVSRKHALIMVMPGGQAKLRDLGSSNGTEVAGRRLGRAELAHGDKVEVGGQQLVFLAGPAAEAAGGEEAAAAEPVSVAPGGGGAGGGAGSVAPTVIGASLDLPQRADAVPEEPAPLAEPRFELIREGEAPLKLGPGAAVIGREPECDVALTTDDQVSRRHAQITVSGPDAKLTDLGSSNGTRLNGEPVRGEVVLADGDVIGIGNTDLVIEIARPVDPRGATVLAPGGLSIPDAPGAAAGSGARAGSRGGAKAGAAGAAGAAAGAGAGAASSDAASSNAGAGGLIVDHASARAILDLPPGAGPDEIRSRYQELFSEYQIRLTNAPTPDLKERYKKRLEELRTAHSILMPDDAGMAGDLPAASPVDAPLPGPAGAGAAAGAAAGAVAGAAGAGQAGAAAGSPSVPPPPDVPSPSRVPAAAGSGPSAGGAGASGAGAVGSPASEPAEPAGAGDSGADDSGKGGGFPKSTWIMAAVVVALLVAIGVFGYLYSGAAEVEQGLRDDLAQRETDLANMRERIPQAGTELESLVAGKAAQLENHEVKICNLGAGEMRVEWLHATRVTEDGTFDSFDSAEHGWKTWQVPPGGSSKFNFVSGDRVLWDGTAVFFSVLFSYRGEEYFRSGPIAELGPDCYNIDLDQ